MPSAYDEQLKSMLEAKYQNMIPTYWGENAPGVVTKVNTSNKVIFLTFDACGGPKGNGYDADLINFLIQTKVPATLFINARWIDANYNTFVNLYKNPQFEIENHGHLHKPLSVNGKSAYGIQGTENIGEVVDEILINEEKITQITGRKPIFFRSGTAYYDEVAVRIVEDLGERAVGYSVLGDAGATYNTAQVDNALLHAGPGSIVIMHMNHPEGFTAEGVKEAIPQLWKNGFWFAKLEDFERLLSAIPQLPTLTGDYFYHTVIQGDSLWKISTRYSVPVSDIEAYNNLTSDTIFIGQSLKLPVTSQNVLTPPVDLYHTAVRGDNLWALSNRYGVKVSDILTRNGLTQNSPIYIGQVILIPMR